MPGSRSQEREHRKVGYRIRSSEHVEIISEKVAVPVGIPAYVTIRLMVDTVAFAVVDSLFQAVTGAGLPFPCSGINRSSVTRDGKVPQINQPFIDGFIQELGFKDIKEPFCRSEIPRGSISNFSRRS